MSSLPLSASATLAHFDFGGGVVQVSSSNSTPTVVSVLDSVSGLGAYQATIADQPQYSRSLYGVPSSYASLAFDGAASVLPFDKLAANVAVNTSFTMYVVASTTVPAISNMDLFSLGKAAADGYIQVFISGSAAGFSAKDDSAVVTAPATAGTVDTGLHLYTLVRDAGARTLTLRLDGTQIITASASGVFTPNTFSFGALRNNSSTGRYLNGNIFEFATFAGAGVSMTSIETFFIDRYLKGINRVV